MFRKNIFDILNSLDYTLQEKFSRKINNRKAENCRFLEVVPNNMKKMNLGMMAMMAKKKTMKMADGGMPMVMKDGKKVPAFAADGVGKMKHGGKVHSDMAKDKPMMKKVAAKAVKGHEKRLHGMAKGGGIETKGKTKGTMIKMKSGGRAC